MTGLKIAGDAGRLHDESQDTTAGVYGARIEHSEDRAAAIRVVEEVDVPVEGHRSRKAGDHPGKLSLDHLVIVCASAGRERPKPSHGALGRHV